jgi:hypothetical protein
MPPIAITASYWLKRELARCEQDAGYALDYTGSIAHGRTHARRRPMIIIGADRVARIRNPIRCGGLVVVATLDINDRQAFIHANRIGALYVIGLPNAGPWLVEQLLLAVTG